MSYARMKQRDAELQADVDRWLAAAQAADLEEDRLHGDKRGDELPKWVADKQRRIEKIRAAEAELEAEAKAAAEEERRIKAEARSRGLPRGAGSGRAASRTSRSPTSPTPKHSATSPTRRAAS
jgi:hypothetical protein